jgi:GTP-binding protein
MGELMQRERARPSRREAGGRCPRIAVIGNPTSANPLVNALLGEERAVVSDTPGTTRDSIRLSQTRRPTLYSH